LDLTISVDDSGFIQTHLYTKDNAKNSDLIPKSNHPNHCRRSIPYSLAFGVLRICRMEEHRKIRFKELTANLIERGYRTKSFDDSISKVKSLRREDILADLVLCPVEKIYGGDFVRKSRERKALDYFSSIFYC
jgi:hypothetical protein